MQIYAINANNAIVGLIIVVHLFVEKEMRPLPTLSEGEGFAYICLRAKGEYGFGIAILK
jgi:hypothetical protein